MRIEPRTRQTTDTKMTGRGIHGEKKKLDMPRRNFEHGNPRVPFQGTYDEVVSRPLDLADAPTWGCVAHPAWTVTGP